MQVYILVLVPNPYGMEYSQRQPLRYYLSMSWWVIRIAFIIFILIPGTLTIALGYLASILYRFVDPNFIVLTFLRDTYSATIGSLPLLAEVIIIELMLLAIIIPYVRRLRRKNPNKTLVEIGIEEVDHQLKKLHKPEKIINQTNPMD